MTTVTLDPTSLPESDTATAAAAAQSLHALLTESRNPEARDNPVMLRTDDDKVIAIPAAALDLFATMLSHLATGEGLTVLPMQAELSTQQAADMLNVSRPFLVELIKNQELPARKVGTHRRVLLSDLLAYKQRDEAAREAVLAKLVAETEALGLYE